MRVCGSRGVYDALLRHGGYACLDFVIEEFQTSVKSLTTNTAE